MIIRAPKVRYYDGRSKTDRTALGTLPCLYQPPINSVSGTSRQTLELLLFFPFKNDVLRLIYSQE